MDRFAGTTARDNALRAVEAGREAFGAGWAPDRIGIAPGRIELLGNHIDYNGGPVLAAAIDRFLAVAVAEDDASSTILRVVAADAPGRPVEPIDASVLTDWRNPHPPPVSFDYVRGLLAAANSRSCGVTAHAATVAFAGDVPIGFGISSSAALCVALALALVGDHGVPEQTVLLAQDAEHRAGTPCGTMDQSASLAGGVIAFDGATLAVERLSPDLGDLVFAVVASGVDRSLSTSSYPVRVAESREALRLANASLGKKLPNLASLTGAQLKDLDAAGALPDSLAKRARHVVEETARVREGREAMLTGDWRRFGELMTRSGRSSATLYEISHPDVEELVSEALDVDGVLGARMMGGGEGGVALVLLSRSAVPTLEAHLRRGYYRRRTMQADDELIHVCAFAPAAASVPGSGLEPRGNVDYPRSGN